MRQQSGRVRSAVHLCWAMAIAITLGRCCPAIAADNEIAGLPEQTPPRQTDPPVIAPLGNGDAATLIGYDRAIEVFKDANGQMLLGSGTTVAVIDTGIVKNHRDFAPDRIIAECNLTGDNGGTVNDATDGNGHGSHVAGIIGADGIHKGLARETKFAIIKALHDASEPVPTFPKNVNDRLLESLQWVLRSYEQLNISVVNVSLSDATLRSSDNFGGGVKKEVRKVIQDLRARRIAVVVAAGNHYRGQNDADRLKPLRPGMGFPAIIRETISVGATYETELRTGHDHEPYGRAQSRTAVRDQIAPFSARLPATEQGEPQTDLLAPGGLLLPSTGVTKPSSHYDHGGTSQAAPQVTAAILMIQQFYRSHTGELPLVDDLERWLRAGGRTVLDGDDEYDNVRHSCKTFQVLDIYGALTRANQQITSLEP